MKKLIVPFLFFIVSTQSSFAAITDTTFYPFGQNSGYYGGQFTDQQIFDLMYAGGARAVRPVFTLQQYLQYGVAPFAPRFNYPYQTLKTRNNVMTLTVDPYGGSYAGQSTKTTAGGKQSLLPASLNLPVFNSDSSINTNNLWAKFVADVYNATQGSFQTYEAFNEPDINNDYVAAEYDSATGNYNTWATREPTPDELPNVYDSLSSEVRIQQITWQVIHHLSNNTVRVATGGISMRYWWRQALKKGIGQYVDVLSMHMYPYYYWTYWTNQSPLGSGNQRYSDMLLRVNDSLYNGMQVISSQNGVSPNLPHMITETNTPRWNYDVNTATGLQNKRVGNDTIQRNYALKGVADFWRKGFSPIIWFQTGEAADSGVISAVEFDAQGMYKNLKTASPGNTVFTQSGKAMQTMQKLCGNYTMDVSQPTFASSVDGILLDSAGYKIYMIWAKTHLDLNETASGTYTLPTGKTYKKYIWDGSSSGTVSGTINLIGDPYILVEVPGTIPPTPPVFNCIVRPRGGSAWYATKSLMFYFPLEQFGCSNQGSNVTVVLPADSVKFIHVATAATGKTISSYSWKQLSGPSTATIVSPLFDSTTFKNLVKGIYIFQCKATDNTNLSATVNDTVEVEQGALALPPLTPVDPVGTFNYYFTVSPNPASDEFKLSMNTKATGFVDVTVFDMLGRKMFNTALYKSSYLFTGTYNTSLLKNGVYYIKTIIGGKEIHNTKLTIIK